MSKLGIDLDRALRILTEYMQERFPEYESASEIADRKLLADGKLTEAQLVEVYSNVFDVPVLDEEEISLPEVPADFPVATSLMVQENSLQLSLEIQRLKKL